MGSAADRGLELDAVCLAVMSLNLLCFATAYGFNGSIDAYASIAYGNGHHAELCAVLYRQLFMLFVLLLVAICILTHSRFLLVLVGVSSTLENRTAEILQLFVLSVAGDFV